MRRQGSGGWRRLDKYGSKVGMVRETLLSARPLQAMNGGEQRLAAVGRYQSVVRWRAFAAASIAWKLEQPCTERRQRIARSSCGARVHSICQISNENA